MPVQVDILEEVLRNKKAELIIAIRSHSSQLNLSDGESELIDRVQAMTRREQAVTILNRLTRTLSEVHAALDTVQDGTYGICVECDEPIAPRRLEAIPWASHCIRCQERLDRGALARSAAYGLDEAA